MAKFYMTSVKFNTYNVDLGCTPLPIILCAHMSTKIKPSISKNYN